MIGQPRQGGSPRWCARPRSIDLYVDQELFALEMEHLFANTRVHVGHDSQVPKVGDYYATTIGPQPVILVRDDPEDPIVPHNRCPHKARASPASCMRQHRAVLPLSPIMPGPLPRRQPAGIPLKSGYDGTGFAERFGGGRGRAAGPSRPQLPRLRSPR